MASIHAKGGRKNRKHGRNKVWCKVYAAHSRREKNKALRLKKHLTRFPDDATAKAVLNSL